MVESLLPSGRGDGVELVSGVAGVGHPGGSREQPRVHQELGVGAVAHGGLVERLGEIEPPACKAVQVRVISTPPIDRFKTNDCRASTWITIRFFPEAMPW